MREDEECDSTKEDKVGGECDGVFNIERSKIRTVRLA